MKKFLKAMLAAMLIAITAVTVCSCGVPSDPAKAKENLKKNGYAVDDTVVTAAIKVVTLVPYGATFPQNIVSSLWATNADGETVLIVYCKDADSAKKVNEISRKLYDEVKKKDRENDTKTDIRSGMSGKVVYIGTKAGVKAAN